MNYEQSSKKFFIRNKVYYKMVEFEFIINGMAYYENDLYMVLINSKHVDSRNDLIDNIIDILLHNFYCSDEEKEMHDENIKEIVEEIENYYK